MNHADLTPPARKPSRHAVRKSELGAALVGRLAATLDKVEQALPLKDVTRMVHDARKAMKEYRALVRLVPGSQAREARRLAAEVARQLSSARDRQACRDALSDMIAAESLGHEDADRAADTIGPDRAAGESRHHERALRSWLSQARASHATALDARARRTDVLAGVRKGYGMARKAGDFSTPERLHDLRKRVVTHRYQMSFIADLFGIGAQRARRAQKLRDVLGAYQDIATLQHHLQQSEASVPPELLSRLRDATEARQRALLQVARDLHAEAFSSKTKDFARKLGRNLERKAVADSA